MQLLEIKLVNWGPFFGEHSIQLEVMESAPVVLFRGENMRGKTSLLRAIVWVLYGQIREQDGRTVLGVERMVNLDAVEVGEISFGVSLRFSHNGAEYLLHRYGVASEERPGKVVTSRPSIELLPAGGLPFPANNIKDIIDGILSREISDFFFFDGEMLNRFEERLRDDRMTAQGFVRAQVERALGLPFMKALEADLDTIQSTITVSMNLVLKKEKKYNELTDKFNAKSDELAASERDLAQLRKHDEDLDREINDLDSQLSKVDEIKDLYFERKSLETEVAKAEDSIKDVRDKLADLSEANWWLPAVELLLQDFETAESDIESAEMADRERFKLGFKLDQLEKQLGTGVCPACGQAITGHDDTDLKNEIAGLKAAIAQAPASSVEDARRRRDQLRKFNNDRSALQRVFDQEQDLGRERLRNDKRAQRIRQISEQISGNTVDIESLERNLIDRKTTRTRTAAAIGGLEGKRTSLKQEISNLGGQIAEQPEVDPTDRRLQRSVKEALTIVNGSFDRFRASMRQRVSTATSELFHRLTTEKEYSGVSISDDYLLTVLDHQQRPLNMISAGANQILTTAFIGALAECSVEEAPMVMDTPFGRLDRGHRAAILDWVSTFDTQVILFVQSGEYDPQRDAHLLGGKIGREYTIERLSPTRSEVRAA